MALLTNINGKFSVSDVGAVTFNNAFTFPTTDGAANYVLQTNGSGQLAWALNGNGDISGSGTANTVTKFTGAKTIGDGPITFSGNNSTFTGNVGIGTNAPVSRLEVYGGTSGTNDVDRYVRFKASNGEKRFDFYMGGTGNASSLGMYTSDGTTKNVQIAAGGTSYFNGGNVGIGTTSPSYNLDVESTTVNNQTIARFSSSGGVRAIINTDSDDDGSFSLYDKNDAAQVLIRSLGSSYFNGGNVGIGTTSPSAKLMIETGGDEGIRIYRSGANANFGAIEFRNNDDSATNSRIGFNANEMRLEATNQFRFVTNSSDRMFINSIGNIGIGTTSPSAPLHISNTYPVIRLTDSDGTAPYAQIINSSGILQLRADDGNSTANSSMQFFVDGTERLTINSSGNATFAGDVLAEDNLYLTDAGTVRGKIQLNSSDRDNLDIKAISLGSLMRFYTVDTLALTLDASQNANFAGDIILQNATPKISLIDTDAGDSFSVNNFTGNFVIKNDTDNKDPLIIDGANNATFSGSITTTSASGIKIDTTGNAILELDGASGSTEAIIFRHSGTEASRIAHSNSTNLVFSTGSSVTTALTLSGTNATFAGTVTAPTFSGDLNGTINTVTTATTKGNSTNDTTVATTAFVQNVIGTIPAGLVFQGTWNASTNSPTLTSGSGTTGNFYIVSVAGSTNLDGITDWQVGDWAVFIEQGASDQWEKIDNSSVLSGSGTGGSFAGWSGSGTSVTLGNAPVTFSGNDSTFAGNVSVNDKIELYSDGTLNWGSAHDSGRLTFDTGVAIVAGLSGKSLVLRSNGSGSNNTALTLDTSQNATFTGNVISLDTFYLENSSGKRWQQLFDGNNWNLRYYNGTSWSADALAIDTSNNVGIGGTPTTDLDVFGNARIGSDSNHALQITDDSAENDLIISTTQRTTLANVRNIKFRTFGSNGTDNILYLNGGNGYVGIGTDSPAAPLDVAFVDNSSPQRWSYSPNESDYFLELDTNIPTGGVVTYNFNVKNNGTTYNNNLVLDRDNVGIGVITPVTKLEVDSSTGNSSIKTGGLEMQSYAVNNGWYAENLYYDGAWRLRSNGHATQMYMEAGIISFKRVASGSAGASVSPLTTMVLDSAGNVGIGKSQSGNAVLTARSSAGGNTGIILIEGDTTDDGWGVYATTANKYIITRFTGGSYSDKFTILEGGNVGIGTSSPATKLHVESDNPIITLQRNNNGNASGALQFRGSDNVVDWQMGTNQVVGLGLEFNFQNSNKVYIETGGNVGIGTTSPLHNLQIGTEATNGSYSMMIEGNFGNTALSSNPRLNLIDTNFGITAGKYGSGTSDDAIGIFAYQGAGRGILFAHTTAGSGTHLKDMRHDMFVDGGTGNVGIGTTSPSGTLHVKDGSVNALFVTSTTCGNVGIKTTSPNASLVVKGNISYSYNNYSSVANTWSNALNFSGYPAGLYQINICKQSNASAYIIAQVKWSGTAGTVINTVTSLQYGITFSGTQLQSIINTTTASSISAQCLVTYELACV